ncbi:MAG: endonuclease/exonuclease/phosphatase family protein, partial [Acidimicrobiia bacterium]
ALPDGGSGELRVAALARVEVAGLLLSVGATHLSFRPGEGPPQLRLLASRLAEMPLPRLLLGDLNLEFDLVEPLVREAGFELALVPPAFPAKRPRRRIDHVAFAGFEVVAVEAPEVAVSDHRPVVVSLRPVA